MRERTRIRIEEERKFKGTKYFNIFYDRDKRKPWFDKMNLDRRLVSTINRLRANHYNLNEFLFRKDYIESSRCDCRAEMQDIDHVVLRCNMHDEARDKIYRELTRLKVRYPYNIEDWLRGPQLPPLKVLQKFLTEIGRII